MDGRSGMTRSGMTSNVLSYLQRSCREFPDKTAVSDSSSGMTYSQLWTRACAAGAGLSGMLRGRRNRPVFVCIGRDKESVAAFFGVLCSGNFYVPVDLSLPGKRLEDIYRTMEPEAVILTDPEGDIRSLGDDFPFPKEKAVFLKELEERGAAEGGCEALAGRTMRESLDTDPAYCIFTSGSTGVPKGVLISHRSIIDMAEQFSETFALDESRVFGNQAPFDFDVSIKDIYLTVRCGASMHILEKPLFMMTKKLVERLNLFRVNTLIWAASAMKVLSALRTFDSILPEHLRLVMFSGEALPCSVLNDWRGHLPGVSFVNLYGPTEITCNCTYYPVEKEFADDGRIPIGRPFRNSGVFLLDGDREVTGEGEPGEICVRGSCLALGYYGDPQRTEASFCKNPLCPDYPERIYRTGDLARWDGEGNLQFIGRADSQIKHMGHRIELGEIETAAGAIPFITAVCCLHHEEKERICLFYEAEQQDDKAVFAALKKTLPGYMIPNRLYYFSKMPENRTGKIDRAFLRRAYLTEAPAVEDRIQTENERTESKK